MLDNKKTNNSTCDVIIIGGGYGGIATGIYLQQCGYSTRILESSALPGGVSTVWRRGDYIFDGATNWVAGSSLSSYLHNMMSEVIDFEKLTFLYPEEFMRIYDGDTHFTVYTDTEKLREEMLRIAPEDRTVIDLFIKGIEDRKKVSIPFAKPMQLASPLEKIKILAEYAPFFFNFLKWKGTSIEAFVKQFKSKKMQRLFLRMYPHHDFFSMFAVISTLAWHSLSAAGYPYGGSEKLLAVMLEKYESLGGEISYKTPVAEVLIEKNRARGVKTAAGTEYQANTVIAACDGKHTLEDLLQGKYRNPFLEKKINRGVQKYPGLFQLSLGLKNKLDVPFHKYNVELTSPIAVTDKEECRDMMIRVCQEESGLSPAGTTTLIIHQRISDVNYWIQLRKENREKYRAEKQRVARELKREVEHFFGELSIACEDTASPATYKRYTNAYNASYQGWAPTPKQIGKEVPMTFRGLKNFYLAGQWVFPAGGITGVIRVARHVTQIICHRDRKNFPHS
ncbi:phytoene desaturase family protein [Chitinivibrio alkaliphilus]|uniref:FAD dependent oxidoreductase n=1 Tax=Chitinivibrio alkaliphilus ACht1 TaxID=1313304 RepID=U7D7K2_9BACT|nr:NAD(P)/FAD-dependent oxidoreductase [Chitinivibrio alkaliphilus]ERP31908.1 FAD dependent oxidoreductase [Chitinivibrio alkaliphilus ACht1]